MIKMNDPSTTIVLPIKLNSVFVYRAEKSAFQISLCKVQALSLFKELLKGKI